MDTKEKSTLPATIGRTIFGLVVTAVLLLIICGGLHFMVKAAQNAGVCESIWQAVGYGFAALGCIAGAYIVLLVYYTKCCHTTGRKVFMVAMVIVMAFAVRFSLQMYAGVLEAAANAENGGVFDAGAGFIEALYGTFGGLTFVQAEQVHPPTGSLLISIPIAARGFLHLHKTKNLTISLHIEVFSKDNNIQK